MLGARSGFHLCCSLRALVILGVSAAITAHVRGHLNVTSPLLAPGERMPNYTPHLRPAAHQLLPYPLLNCAFVFKKYGPIWLHWDFLGGRS